MGAVLTVNETKTEMIRLVNGKLVKEEAQRNLYEVPPRKAELEFTVTGYALPFEMPKGEQFGGGIQTMTRLELTFKGGKMTTVMFGFSIGAKSNLGNFLRNLGVDLTPDEHGQWDLDRAIGYTGKGYFIPSDKLDDARKPKYCKVEPDTVSPISAPAQAYRYDETISDVIPAAPATNGHSNGNHAPADDGWE